MFECEPPKTVLCNYVQTGITNDNTSFQIGIGDDSEDQSTPPRQSTKKKRKNIGRILFVASIAVAIAIPILLFPGIFGFFPLWRDDCLTRACVTLHIYSVSMLLLQLNIDINYCLNVIELSHHYTVTVVALSSFRIKKARVDGRSFRHGMCIVSVAWFLSLALYNVNIKVAHKVTWGDI